MTETAAGHCFTNSYSFELGALPFREVPGQSRLFLDFMRGAPGLSKYYPEAVESHLEIASRIPRVLENFKVDREALCDALEAANRNAGSGEKTFDNLRRLRGNDCVAVMSGQQAGLFGGPLFTVYKALSAVKLAKCLSDRGYNAVPVFWIATEDHDFDEVSKTYVIGKDGKPSELSIHPEGSGGRLPVGQVKLDEGVVGALDRLFDELAHTEFTPELKELLYGSWRPGEPVGNAFAKLMAGLFKEHGLILLCPLQKELKKLAAPVYSLAISRSEDIVRSLRERNAELEADGYHAQVHIAEEYFPLFWQADDGTRNALRRTPDGMLVTKDDSVAFSSAQLLEIAAAEPWRLSPSVVLRSVVQDYLLPTVAYFGGAAEVAYFAQSSVVYRTLDRPVTPIIHRESFTVVEPRHRKTLGRYDLDIKDLFAGMESLLPKIVESHLNQAGGEVFAEVEARIASEIDRLGLTLNEVDKTLGDNLAMRRRKIVYHLEALRKKFHNAQVRKDTESKERLEAMFASILPNQHLQERSLNVSYFLNRYGRKFIDWVFEAIDLDDKDHRVLYL